MRTNPALSTEPRVGSITASPSTAICPPGRHAFAAITGTYRGQAVAHGVHCTRCRRSFETVMEQQPEELERYRAWLEAEAGS